MSKRFLDSGLGAISGVNDASSFAFNNANVEPNVVAEAQRESMMRVEDEEEKEENIFHLMFTESLNDPSIVWEIKKGEESFDYRIGRDVEEALQHNKAA